jgi:hypothetical protein
MLSKSPLSGKKEGVPYPERPLLRSEMTELVDTDSDSAS